MQQFTMDEDAVDVDVGGAATPGTRHGIKAVTAQVGSWH
jgi:hypothetical protein